jgi:hypothetical protein
MLAFIQIQWVRDCANSNYEWKIVEQKARETISNRENSICNIFTQTLGIK